MRFTTGWIAEVIQGRMKRGESESGYIGISTDSRFIRPGQVFWALKGERFDGHDFLEEAVRKGASGLVVQKGTPFSGIRAGASIIEVDDTLQALGDLAAKYRRLYDIPLVAVTGSNGKTTTKEMIASILSTKKRVLKNKGNFNNLIGLPLSLLNLSVKHDVGVVELGMNRRGEIARLTKISDPTVGVVTNIGPVHLEHLKTLAAVAEAKGELFQEMSSEATAIINKDDPQIDKLSQKFSGKKITIGIAHPGEVSARSIKLIGEKGIKFDLMILGETIPIYLPMIGEHNVMNVLAAAAAVVAVGEKPDIIPGALEQFANFPLRQEIVKLSNDITVINDAYNANPISMKLALDTFLDLKGSARGVAVLGDMLELGSEAVARHHKLGEQIAQSDIDCLFLMGNYATEVRVGAIAGGFPSESIVIGRGHQELADLLKTFLKKGDWMLVKGSRGMEMEKVVKNLSRKNARYHQSDKYQGVDG